VCGTPQDHPVRKGMPVTGIVYGYVCACVYVCMRVFVRKCVCVRALPGVDVSRFELKKQDIKVVIITGIITSQDVFACQLESLL
jgi:hypothetical protein